MAAWLFWGELSSDYVIQTATMDSVRCSANK